jgi:hypothetical protein
MNVVGNQSTHGQRLVVMPDRRHIVLRDFNLYHIKRLGKDFSGETPTAVIKVKAEPKLLDPHESPFVEDVWSELPYVELTSLEEFNYSDFIIDEEGIIGVEVCLFRNSHLLSA